MSHPFKAFEVEVLANLLKPYFNDQELLNLLNHAESEKVENTNYGFFVTITNSCIGRERRVCDKPLIIGELDNQQAGFVVFLENNELMLDIFPFTGESLPANFRECDVKIVVKAN